MNTGDISRRLLALVGPPFSSGRARYVTGVVGSAMVMEWAILCPVCEFTLPDYTDQAEAAYLAGIHNDLHHGSHLVATVEPVWEPLREPQSGGAV